MCLLFTDLGLSVEPETMRTKSNLEMSTVYKLLSAYKELSFRAITNRNADGWRIHSMYVVNSRHKTVPSGFWNYGEVGFVVKQIAGTTVTRWLRQGKVKFDSWEFLIPALQSNVHMDRFPSHTSRDWLADIYPFSTYRVGFAERDDRLNEFDPLISPGLPSFEGIKAAAFHYLFDRESERDLPLENQFLLQLHNKECWIDKIYLQPSSITVSVKGSNVRGSRLEARVGREHFETRLGKPERKVFLLAKGLSDKLWIVVSKKDRWLDYHEANLKYRSYSSSSDDLVIAYLDKQLELESTIARGEGETTEFKVQVPASKDSIHKLVRTVSAFANGDGGVVVIGVEDDTGRIVGIKGSINKEKDRLTQIVRDNLTHQPPIKIHSQELDGAILLVVEITKGSNPPYGINRSDPRYYVRRGATTLPASPDEIQVLIRDQNGKFSALSDYFR